MAFKRRLKFDKRIKHKRKMNILYILVFIALASFGVGYSYISTQLNVNGTANVTAASWDVHFDNLNVTEGSVTATTPADITSDTTVEFAATLEEPGDFYEFTVDVTNQGSMDAMIDDFSISPTLTTAQAKYLEYQITYSDGAPLANKQELKAGLTETLKVRFSYIENSDKTNYPTEDQTFTVSFTADYTQADNTAIEIVHPVTKYTVNVISSDDNVRIGYAIPSTITQYSTAAEALAAIRNLVSDESVSFYIKNVMYGGIVKESYVEFIVTETMANNNSGMTAGTYTLRGLDTYDENASSTNYCKSEFYDETAGKCSSPYYISNKKVLLKAFGSSNCQVYDFDDIIDCNVESIRVYSAASHVYAGGNYSSGYWNCSVYDDGLSGCYNH